MPAVTVVSLASRTFWDFGSLFLRRCGVRLASCCGSGNLIVMCLQASASGHAPLNAAPPRWQVLSYRHLSSSGLSWSDRGFSGYSFFLLGKSNSSSRASATAHAAVSISEEILSASIYEELDHAHFCVGPPRWLARCRGSRIFRPRRWQLRLRVAAQASRTSHSGRFCNSGRRGAMYHVLSRQACLFLQSTFSLGCVVFDSFAGEMAEEALPSGFSYLETLFQGGSTTFVLQDNFHSFSMALFTGRGRHHSSSRGGGAWGQCCHVENFRLQPSWGVSLLLPSLLWTSLSFVLP